jgi:predicted flavoprotein YhiN
LLTKRHENMGNAEAGDFFTGILNGRVGRRIIKEACDIGVNARVRDFTAEDVQKITETAKRWKFNVTGVRGFQHAQATGGGVSINEFNPDNMESTIMNGLFAAGEVFDVFGGCGGYNLHFAFTTGLLAGYGAAESLNA